MQLTEAEMTAALQGAAKSVLAAQRKDVRKGRVDIDDAWEELGRYQRFKMLDALGDQLLPVLVALPDVEVEPGARPSYSDAEIAAVVEEKLGEREGGRLRRKVVLAARVALVKAALAAVPPKGRPDTLDVPDHL